MNTKLEELKAKVAEIQKEIDKLEKEESKYLDLSVNENWVLGNNWRFCEFDIKSIQLRQQGIYKNKGFYLTPDYNWEIVKDEIYNLVLLPTKK